MKCYTCGKLITENCKHEEFFCKDCCERADNP